MLHTGTGTKKDDTAAAEYWESSAMLGNVPAQYALGKLYRDGDCVPRNIAKAMKLFLLSANQKNDYAQYQLGKLYLADERVPKDVDSAIRWLDESAEQGNQYAQYILGKLYLCGKEIPHDKEKAVQYLEASAAQGNLYARFFLDHLDSFGNPSAFLAATRLQDREIVSGFMKEKVIYEVAQFHNAVFVGFDAEGTARQAHKRGTYHPENWKRHSYVCLCGVGEHALLQLLKENQAVQKAVLCLDHDAAGIEASGRLEEILREQSRAEVYSLKPRHKDWNEDLKAARGREALPAEEHPQLLLRAAFFRNLSEREERKGQTSVHNLLDRGREATWLMADSKLPSPDLREEVTEWCQDMVLQCLALEQKEIVCGYR